VNAKALLALLGDLYAQVATLQDENERLRAELARTRSARKEAEAEAEPGESR
jgi:uncharacterized small protein (DUF1192 family)